MGTGAVYVTLSGLKDHSPGVTTLETVFFFINIALFLLNSTTLALQAICTCFSISGIWFCEGTNMCEQYILGSLFD